MTWTLRYSLYRDRPLTDEERKLIDVPFREGGPDGAIASAEVAFPDEGWEEDLERLVAKLNQLASRRKELGIRMKCADDRGHVKWHYKHGYIIDGRVPVEPPKPETPWQRGNRISELVEKDPEAARPLLLRELAANHPDSAGTLISAIDTLGDLGRELLDQALARGYYSNLAIYAAEELRADDPAWWLSQLGHRSHFVRVRATRWLRKNGHPQALAATAAVWDSIDHHRRVAHDDLDRSFAAESLGIARTYNIDWRAALGSDQWLDLPPLPSAHELLFDPDEVQRRQGAVELSDKRDLRDLRLLSRLHAHGLLLIDPLESWIKIVPHGDLPQSAFREIWRSPPQRAIWIEQHAPPGDDLLDRPLPTRPALTIDPKWL